jgi:hypothetical protein
MVLAIPIFSPFVVKLVYDPMSPTGKKKLKLRETHSKIEE